MTSQLLYAVSGLTLDTTFDANTGFHAPCADTSKNQLSRWIKDPTDTVCENVANLAQGTLKIYQNFVDTRDSGGDLNQEIVDANRDMKVCDLDDQSKTYLGKVRASDGACWHHAHYAELDVYDLTGADELLYTVIDGSKVTLIDYSALAQSYAVVGKFGDHVDLDDRSLPSPLNDVDVQEAYKTLEYNPEGLPLLMCGSPEEVAR